MKTLVTLLTLISALTLNAEVINVPDDHETIQGAIDASEDGDTVLVAPGEYVENLDLDGRSITIASLHLLEGDDDIIDATIIDGNGEERCIFGLRIDDEDDLVVIHGFTIRNGNADVHAGRGGGLYLHAVNAEIRHCKIVDNVGIQGGAMYLDTGQTLIYRCYIASNQATDFGGCIRGNTMDVSVLQSVIAFNTAPVGGGIQMERGTLALDRCTLYGNRATVDNDDSHGGGIYMWRGQVDVSATNSILYGNTPEDVFLSPNGFASSYNLIIDDNIIGDREFLQWNDGNIDANPLFVNADEGNFHLTEDSPCIDAGDPDSPDDPDGTRADMGAYYYPQRDPDDDGVLHVPDEYETIQEAIDTAEDGDTVLVAPGEYVENINFEGKAIVVIGNPDDPSEVIIDGSNNNSSVVSFINEETDESEIIGFTITDGSPSENYGGGIICEDSSPKVSNCVIASNRAHSAAGIYINGNSNVHVNECTFSDNVAGFLGGGAQVGHGADATFERCLFWDNSAWESEMSSGHAIFVGESEVNLINCTISNPEIEDGIWENYNAIALAASQVSLNNCIIWTDWGINIVLLQEFNNSQITVNYSDIEGGQEVIFGDGVNWGEGNIDENPLFVNIDDGDHHLTEDSPCIDAGDPDSPEDPDGTRADMGAYHFHQRDIDVMPVELQFEPIEWEAVDSQAVEIRNVGGNDLHITEFMVPLHPSFFYFNEEFEPNPPISIPPDSAYLWWIYFHPQLEGLGQALFETSYAIVTDDPDEPEVGIEVSGDVLGVDEEPKPPLQFGLKAVYPNPFNASTTIHYSLPQSQQLNVRVFDLTGRLVETLYEGNQAVGLHSIVWNSGEFGAGVYLVQVQAGIENRVAKLVVVK